VLKTHWRIVSWFHRLGDNAIIIAAFLLTYYLRDSLLAAANTYGLPFPQELKVLGSLDQYFIVLGAGLPLFNAFLGMQGAYRSMRFLALGQLLRLAFVSAGLTFLCAGFFLFLLKIDISRSFVMIFCLFSGVGLFVERAVVLSLLRLMRIRGKNYRNLLIVGTGAQARSIYLEIARQPELGVRAVGFVEISPQDAMVEAAKEPSAVYDLGARIVATQDTFEAALKRHAVDEVLFTDVFRSFTLVQTLVQIAVEEGVRVTLAGDMFSTEIFQSAVSYFGKIPLIHYEPSPGGSVDNAALIVKRLMDIVISAGALVLLSPLLVATALAIKLDSPGPVFFRQRRVGLNGRTFMLYKFRSMINGAEQMLPQLLAQNEMNGPVFKLRHDPRITRVGKFIRRYSIDELPQLLHVLIGDMSLVGPRPPLPEEVERYGRKQRKRLSMRPGLTCIWQVSGRSSIPDFDQWAKLDLEYIDNWSLKKDIELLLKTIPAVLSGAGAH